MNSAAITIEEVVVAILELAKRKLNEQELAVSFPPATSTKFFLTDQDSRSLRYWSDGKT